MNQKDLFKEIPKVDILLEDEEWMKNFSEIPRDFVIQGIRNSLDNVREMIKDNSDFAIEMIKNIKNIAEDEIKKISRLSLRTVINATGVILHTNLGRSLISDDIIDNISSILTHYSNLEYDLENGRRGSRYSHAVEIIRQITSAEDAMVVNNNAAAVILVLNTLAKGKEVITSRGELVEIGGAFRIPDVMEWSGATLVDVGTTNKTHYADYENAVTENTAAILKVHTSNYRIQGFTESVPAKELLNLNLPILEDLGSGVMIDLSKYGMEKEPTIREALESGVDIVTFSGDKLLGGPQAGIIIGKKKYIDKMKKNPLTRALRVDKFTLCALEATLRFYLDEKVACEKIPTLKMITENRESVKKRAEKLKELLISNNFPEFIDFKIEECDSQVGGGSLPTTFIPSYCVAIYLTEKKVEGLEVLLRKLDIPIIGRISENKLILDMRTVRESELEIMVEELLMAVNLL